jgi:iron complex transport system ATP-binding protein
VIRADGVEVGFGDVPVLDGVDLTVERGEFVGLVGPNGAGKTTLLRTINGVLEPDGGEVRIDDRRVSSLAAKAVSRLVATVPQNTNLGFSFTAEQIVEMGRTPHRSRLDWHDDGDPVRRAMERTETTPLRERTVDELSGGERQRVLLARALAQGTPALVLDEPTANLDINHQVGMLDTVADLVAEGRAAVAAIHDLDLAARYCDRLCLLSGGTIRAAGPPDEVLADPVLADAFGTQTAVSHDPVTGTASVAAVGHRPDRAARVHVVGGGRIGARVLGELWRAGFDASVGVVGTGDEATRVARELDAECVTAPPFRPPGEETLAEARQLLGRADAVVRTPGPGADVTPTGMVGPDSLVRIGPDDEPAAAVGGVLDALARQPAWADD